MPPVSMFLPLAIGSSPSGNILREGKKRISVLYSVENLWLKMVVEPEEKFYHVQIFVGDKINDQNNRRKVSEKLWPLLAPRT
jgi:hypothetical protein